MRINYKIDWKALGEMQGSHVLSPKKYLILEAALKIIAHAGLQQLSVTSIAKETQFSKPLVLYHFESKERALEELYFFLTKMGEYFLDPNIEKDLSFEKRMTDLVSGYFRWSLFNKEVSEFFCLMPHLGGSSFLLEKYQKNHREFIQRTWERIFLESLRFRSMEELKIAVFGAKSMVYGSLYQMINEQQRDQHEEVAQNLKFNLEALLKVELPRFDIMDSV